MTIIPKEIQDIIDKENYIEDTINHQIYGNFIINKLYKTKFYNSQSKNIEDLDNYLIFITNNQEYPFYFYNKKSCLDSKISNNYDKIHFKLTKNNGTRKDINILNIMLSSVFYEKLINENMLEKIKTQIDIDHINSNHKNNLITNIRFQCSCINYQDGQKKSLETIELQNGRYGSPTMLQYYNSYKDEYIDIKMFKNINRVSKFIFDNKLSNSSIQQLDKNIRRILNKEINQNNVSNIFSVRKINNNDELIEEKYNNEDIQQYSLENYIKLQEQPEIWKDIPKKLYNIKTDRKYQVSNYGRVKNLNGEIMRPNFHRYGKYQSLRLNSNKIFYIHYLVYITFIKYFEYKDFYDEYDNGENKQIKYVIKHNDKAPLFQTNSGKIYYRNFVEDLTLGSQTENMIEWHQNKSYENELITITDYDYDYEDNKLLQKIKFIRQKELEDFPKSDGEINEKGNKYFLYIYDKDNKQLNKIQAFKKQEYISIYIHNLEPDLTQSVISKGLIRIKNNNDKKYYKKKYYIKDYYQVLEEEYNQLYSEENDNDADKIIEINNNYDYEKDIQYYMENKPKYININNSKDRPPKYIISKSLTNDKVLNLCGLGKYPLKIKFLQAIHKYMDYYETNNDIYKIKFDIKHLVSQLDENEKKLYEAIIKL